MVSLPENIRRTWLVAVKRRAHHDDRAPSPPDDVRWSDGDPAPFKLYLRLYRPTKKLLDSTIGRRLMVQRIRLEGLIDSANSDI
jgi:hypothetical protein